MEREEEIFGERAARVAGEDAAAAAAATCTTTFFPFFLGAKP